MNARLTYSRIVELALPLFAAVLLCSNGVLASPDGGKDGAVQEGLGISADFGKWDQAVQWVYNSTDAPFGFTDDNLTATLIQAGLAEWSLVCGINFQYLGVDDGADITNTGDGIVVVEWDDTIGAAGLAGPFWVGGDRTGPGHYQYTDGTLRLNPLVFDATGLSPDQLLNNLNGFLSTVTHEGGHLVGIGHSSEPLSIMWANPYNSLNHIRGDDIRTCRSIYGYSDLYVNPEVLGFLPDPAGDNNYNTLFLSSSTAPTTPIDTDTGTAPENATLLVRWIHTADDGYDDTLTQYVVDPDGFLSIQTSTAVQTLAGGVFGIASFERLREQPGLWTVYLSDSTGLVTALTLDVQTALPAGIEPPGATLAIAENPATRQTEITVDVTSVSAAATTPNQVTVNWHIGSQGFATENVAVPGSATQNFAFPDANDHEVHVEVIDDQPRYTQDLPNNIGGAGAGFQTLFRYSSPGVNLGPDNGGDNSSDIVLYNIATGGIFLWNMHGNLIDPRGAIGLLADVSWRIEDIGDYNGDGKSDILWHNTSDNRIYIWLMSGRTILQAGLAAIVNSAYEIKGSGDFDGDGNTDILWRHIVNGRIYIWHMNGTAIASASRVNSVASGDLTWFIRSNGDFTGDGLADILWWNSVTGQVYLWEMNGGTIVAANPVAVIPSDSGWEIRGDGDYDGDGIADLVWQRRGGISPDGKVYYWKMNGATIDSSARISIVADLEWEIRGNGDYNGDGMSDLLWRHSNGDIYHWQQAGALTIRGGTIATMLDAEWNVVHFER